MADQNSFELTIEWNGQKRLLYLRHNSPLKIGRNPSLSLCIPSQAISSEHLSITLVGDELIVQDLESSNGTFRLPQKSPFLRSSFSIKNDGDLSLNLAQIVDVHMKWAGQMLASASHEPTQAVHESTQLEAPLKQNVVESDAPQFVQNSKIDEKKEAPAQNLNTAPRIPLDAKGPIDLSAHYKQRQKQHEKDQGDAVDELQFIQARQTAAAAVLLAISVLLQFMSVIWGHKLIEGTKFIGVKSMMWAGAAYDFTILWLDYFATHWLIIGVVFMACYLFGRWLLTQLADSEHSIVDSLSTFFHHQSHTVRSSLLTLSLLFLIGAFLWPMGLSIFYGVRPAKWGTLWKLKNEFLAVKDFVALSQQEPAVVDARHLFLNDLKKQFPGSSFLYLAETSNQRARVLRDCDGVGQRPWANKKVCLILMSGVAIESGQEIRPVLIAEVALRVALLSVIDAASRIVLVDGPDAPELNYLLGSLFVLGLDEDAKDLETLIKSPLVPVEQRLLNLEEIRHRIEVRLDSRQKDLDIPPALRGKFLGPLEFGI